jgi:hypothetical protein
VAVRFYGTTANLQTDNVGYSTFGNCTVAGWFKLLKNPAAVTSMAGMSTDAGSAYENVIRMNTSGIPDFYSYDGSVRTATSSIAMKIGLWYHLIGIAINSSVLRIYLDGIERGSSGLGSVTGGASRRIRVGGNMNLTTPWDTAEFEVFDFACWSTDIAQRDVVLLASGANPVSIAPTSLEVYWPCGAEPRKDYSHKRASCSFAGSSLGNIPTSVVDNKLSTHRDAYVNQMYYGGLDSATSVRIPGRVTRAAVVALPEPDSPLVVSDFPANTANYFSNGTGGTTNLTGYGITCAAWVRFDSVAVAGIIMAKYNTSANGQFVLELDASAGCTWVTVDGANNTMACISSALSANRWYHWVGTQDANGGKLYIDGKLAATSGTPRIMVSTGNTFYIGRYETGGSFPMDGGIDQAVLWNAGLSANEVLDLYKGLSPLMIRPNNLVGYWPLGAYYGKDLSMRTPLTYSGTVSLLKQTNLRPTYKSAGELYAGGEAQVAAGVWYG